MLSKKERERIKKNMVATDYHLAAERYTEITGIPISAKYIAKVINGECLKGARRSKHNLEALLNAIAETVKQRRASVSEALRSLEAAA